MKSTKRKINKRLFRKVQKHILQEPERMDMGIIAVKGDEIARHCFITPPCNTVGCIAGWANILSGHPRAKSMALAAKLLGVSGNGSGDRLGTAANIFHVHRWPSQFRRRYWRSAQQSHGRAKAVSDRIDYFLEHGK